jgi:hypothetical protein
MVNVSGRASDDAQSIIDPPSNASRSAAAGTNGLFVHAAGVRRPESLRPNVKSSLRHWKCRATIGVNGNPDARAGRPMQYRLIASGAHQQTFRARLTFQL